MRACVCMLNDVTRLILFVAADKADKCRTNSAVLLAAELRTSRMVFFFPCGFRREIVLLRDWFLKLQGRGSE